jgi:hypothetical protein
VRAAVVVSSSPPNQSIRFTEKRITIEFDEFILLRSMKSPSTNYRVKNFILFCVKHLGLIQHTVLILAMLLPMYTKEI